MTVEPAFVRGRGPGKRGELSADPRYASLLTAVDRLAALVDDGTALKRDDDHAVLVVTPAAGASPLLCKFFPVRSLLDRLWQRWGLDRPARMHRRLKRVTGSNLPVPPTLGHVSVAGVGAAWFCPLLSGTGLLYWTGDKLPDSPAGRAALLNPVLDTMLELHRAGFVHGDFKWGNVLRDGDACWLVDVDGLRAVTVTDFCRGKARDLARFLLDCEEAGVPADEVWALMCRYAALAAHTTATVEARVNPVLARLRERHRRRYGEGYRLTLYGPAESS